MLFLFKHYYCYLFIAVTVYYLRQVNGVNGGDPPEIPFLIDVCLSIMFVRCWTG